MIGEYEGRYRRRAGVSAAFEGLEGEGNIADLSNSKVTTSRPSFRVAATISAISSTAPGPLALADDR